MAFEKISNQDLVNLDNKHNVPSLDSLENILIRDVVGNKRDFVGVPYTADINSILGFLKTGYFHIHGTSFVYPDHADNVTLTAGAGAWNLTGDITEVIPAGALNEFDFDLHWINISDISGNGLLQIDVFSGLAGAEIRIGSTRPFRNAVQSQEGPRMIMIPQQLHGSRISCRLSDSTAGALTCAVSFEGHYYGI